MSKKEYIERETLGNFLRNKIADYEYMVQYERKHGSVSDIEKAKAKVEATKEIYGFVMSRHSADVEEARHASWVYGEYDNSHCSDCGHEVKANNLSPYLCWLLFGGC